MENKKTKIATRKIDELGRIVLPIVGEFSPKLNMVVFRIDSTAGSGDERNV